MEIKSINNELFHSGAYPESSSGSIHLRKSSTHDPWITHLILVKYFPHEGRISVSEWDVIIINNYVGWAEKEEICLPL